MLWLNLTTTNLGSLRNNRHVLVPFTAAVTTKHCENVAIISSNSNVLYLMPTGSLRILYHHRDRDLLRKQGIYGE